MNHKITVLIIGFIATGSILIGSVGATSAKTIKIPSDRSVAKDSSSYDFSNLTVDNAIKFLGWIKDKDCDSSSCCGHYFESSNVVNNPAPKALSDQPMSVTAVKPGFFTQNGESIVRGDVVLSQPGRELTSDQATFFRDRKTGKVSKAIFVGDVNFREYGKLVVAEEGEFDFVKKIYSANNAIYRCFRKKYY